MRLSNLKKDANLNFTYQVKTKIGSIFQIGRYSD